eukprot:TRINITY_DN2035_c0_g1_i2.p1 TRINITY_DN2035_c0_g1~~TRINITY_DN2035_c0_g1_i2.p1  ORF type:complete len:313 (+),score=40.63 TRINITY_DN2035_c0_g1_i2:121-939(+)
MPGHSQFEFHSLAANLALCGDIGNPFTAAYEEFVAVQAARFLHVFIVAGNHEFYESEYGAARERVRQVCARHANVAFLDGIQSAICDGGTVRVIGCTLWAHDSVASFNDYRVVAYGKRRLTMRDTAQLHTQEVAYIESELLQAKACGQQVVCLSHHVPYFNCPSVGTDLLPLIQGADSTLRLWCFGHTHHSVHNMCDSYPQRYQHPAAGSVGLAHLCRISLAITSRWGSATRGSGPSAWQYLTRKYLPTAGCLKARRWTDLHFWLFFGFLCK